MWVCAWTLDLTQNRKEPLGWLEHGYAYLRVNKKTRLQAIMDKARCLLHALPRESNLADEGKVRYGHLLECEPKCRDRAPEKP